MKRYVKVNLILTFLILIVSIIFGMACESWIQQSYNFEEVTLSIDYFYCVRMWKIAGVTFMVGLMCLIMSFNGGMLSRVGDSRNINVGLENAHFMTKKELKKNYKRTRLSKLKKVKSGVLVKAEEKRKDMEIALTEPIHTLVIGTTGSGKTQTFISPTIEVLGRCKDKPSMIISDPKGELFKKHSQNLHMLGYNIQLVDLINPLDSTRWNPLSPIYDNYQLMLAEKNKKAQQKILDDVYDDIRELVLCLFKGDENAKDKIWDHGMQNFIQAILIAMLEDSEDKSNGMTKAKYNFATVRSITTNTQNECAALKEYFYKRPKTSEARMRASQVLDTSDRTQQSYLTVIAQAMTIFADISICSMMSENRIDVRMFDEIPTALFLKIPDERVGRYNIAAAFFASTYKELVAKARKYKNDELARPVYFIIDEFGNLPQIAKFDKMLSVARARKIFFEIVVQSYEQIENIYGKYPAEIIRGQCPIEIYIGCKELGTLEAISKKLGNYTVTSSSVSSSKVGDYSGNMSTKERPLMYPTQLAQFNNPPKIMGNTIVMVGGKPPLKSKFTPHFKSKIFKVGEYDINIEENEFFDNKTAFYDISGTNKFEIPEEVHENEVEHSKVEEKPTYFISEIVVKYVSMFKVENAENLEKLFQTQNYELLIELIKKAMDIAKEKNIPHARTALASEFITIENLHKKNQEENMENG